MIITETERSYLMTSMEGLLDEYGYTYTVKALNKIIDEWAESKSTLIEAFKKHPNYLEGKFMIAFSCNYERVVNANQSGYFSDWLRRWVISNNDYNNNIPEEIKEMRDREGCAYLPNKLHWFLMELNRIAERTVSSETAEAINEMVPAMRVHNGEKTSRVINKLCTYLGYNKHPEYNKEFAKYADSLSPVVITRHTILSLNPLDYLTMSFGNSWASCHTIDKNNKRCMPNSYEGMYSSGTMSYMLDPSSMVLYTVDASYNGNEFWSQPKIHRQMFHWGEEKLVQGRLYPQSNDCDGTAYTPYRNIVQEIMSKIFEFPNLWIVKKGTEAASNYIETEGTHYADYENFGSCTLSRIKGSENENYFVVGASPICIECGYTHTKESCINCCTDPNAHCCSDCGCDIYDEDDVIWINGSAYCRDCVHYCEHCAEYHRQEEYYIDDRDIYVCESCFDEYYVYCEECCRNVDRDDARWIESEGNYVCDECVAENYFECEECEEYFHNDDAHEHEGRCLCEDCYEECKEDEDESNEAEAC